ncbi:aromatic ring-hydroxylating oxygenase subunit alpha [Actibacterium pelagium]|uniref:(2Fe-2S)-binding protein n=1 Tax=Actibacterium pelagium TaxID=2029103 RepID=A0A917EML8_9RHOB|nr:aromatic ring-hydroxylating dioxygenase subunit alpha [Actibacterium pelagium]GGE61772.1 (2Fe-2S)-binding protein [Actibacterium pelagium]
MNHRTSLSSVLSTVNKANGLPNEHYIDADVFNEEKRSVLFANWSGVGFGKDIPEAGDAKPVDFLGMPLLLVRDRDGNIGVFQNTCRHRGMILVDKPKKIGGAIRCPYHSWCYGLDGRLRATPHIGGPGQNTHEDIDTEELGLVRIRSHVWRDVIFVNVDGDAQDFETEHAVLIDRWTEFDQPMFYGGDGQTLELNLKTNWKLAVENYCESYHLPWVHPGLNSYSRLEDHYNIDEAQNFAGQGTVVYRQIESDDRDRLKDFDGLSEKWDQGAEYVAVYPNVLLGVHRDHAFAIIVHPTGIETTMESIALYYAEDPNETSSQAELRKQNAALWSAVFEEDVFVVEGMQKGRHAEFFDGGRFSPVMDGPTHNFHHWVATQVEYGRRKRSPFLEDADDE